MAKAKGEDRINFLARKWKSGNITDEEIREFEHWYHSFDDRQKIIDQYISEGELKQKIYKEIEKKIQRNSQKTTSKWKIIERKWRIAASILFMIGIGLVFFYYDNNNNRNTPANSPNLTAHTSPLYDVIPGGDKAILLLSDGRQMVLDGNNRLAVSDATGNRIISDGKTLFFQLNESENTKAKISYNTVVTPSSGQFQIVLPDSSRVWLNAESSLKFPNRFEGKREVVLTGEAYFEIAQDITKPFKVFTDEQQIEVLG
ncbi:MAG TPA: FecR family protein, partial [Flavobacteriaceae bacterium]|nr:FecR family protein [Flavobacteriaceae bacterium]